MYDKKLIQQYCALLLLIFWSISQFSHCFTLYFQYGTLTKIICAFLFSFKDLYSIFRKSIRRKEKTFGVYWGCSKGCLVGKVIKFKIVHGWNSANLSDNLYQCGRICLEEIIRKFMLLLSLDDAVVYVLKIQNAFKDTKWDYIVFW